MLVLVVEDEAEIAETFCDALESSGYTCETVSDGNQASNRLAEKTYDLILLDIELPGKSGLELLQEIRAGSPEQPVLLITARADLADRVAGLDLGADDYLVKPVALPELQARIRSVLRRAGDGSALVLRVADLDVDIANHRVTRAGVQIELTGREFDLLVYLARRVGRTASYEDLARDVWEHSEKATPINNLVAVHVSNLRDKLDEGGRPRLIQTVWGKGFKLTVEGE